MAAHLAGGRVRECHREVTLTQSGSGLCPQTVYWDPKLAWVFAASCSEDRGLSCPAVSQQTGGRHRAPSRAQSLASRGAAPSLAARVSGPHPCGSQRRGRRFFPWSRLSVFG